MLFLRSEDMEENGTQPEVNNIYALKTPLRAFPEQDAPLLRPSPKVGSGL